MKIICTENEEEWMKNLMVESETCVLKCHYGVSVDTFPTDVKRICRKCIDRRKQGTKMKRTKIDRNHETEKKLDAMWNDLSEKAREVIATTDMWVIDELFGNLETPDEVNKFIDEEWDDVNNFIEFVVAGRNRRKDNG